MNIGHMTLTCLTCITSLCELKVKTLNVNYSTMKH